MRDPIIEAALTQAVKDEQRRDLAYDAETWLALLLGRSMDGRFQTFLRLRWPPTAGSASCAKEADSAPAVAERFKMDDFH
jgi:hypothetical protein